MRLPCLAQCACPAGARISRPVRCWRAEAERAGRQRRHDKLMLEEEAAAREREAARKRRAEAERERSQPALQLQVQVRGAQGKGVGCAV